uniref:Uncharacterized protein n=1 Tax=Hanusia phi TaxID=3032 RepID=A0A7S0EN91_9CRYP
MIYMEPSALGLMPLAQSWLSSLPQSFASAEPVLLDFLQGYLENCITFVRKNLVETVATVDNNLAQSLFRLLSSIMHNFEHEVEHIKAQGDEENQQSLPTVTDIIAPLFFFCLTWSVGGSCDLAGRSRFNEYLRQLARTNDHDKFLPPDGSVYEFCYLQNLQDFGWKRWMDTRPPVKLDPKASFSSMIVPTVDTIRYANLIGRLVSQEQHVLCVGDTGTGKTLTVMDQLFNGMPKGFETVPMSFSASTSANQTQDILDAKFDKRRKGVFGPPAGTKFIIMVDDFNMPAREKYFAQPPLELLRQWMDHGGWFDRKLLQFREIIDIIFVAAMGPPGGGRNPISARMLRHFNFLSFTTIENESLNRIFGTILKTFISANFNSEDFQSLVSPLVEATVEVYDTIAAELLPTPAKSHYTFNLRDLAKVFQGVLAADTKTIADGTSLIRLWAHECMRVFGDRLVNDEDREWFGKLRDRQLSQRFELSWKEVCPGDRLLFADFTGSGDPKPYVWVEEPEKLVHIFEGMLDDYNVENTKRLDLVLFMDAIEHISRISRIIRQPKGNALLLGVGGSGRQSLTRLASFAADYKCFQIEISKNYGMNEWREDLRSLLKLAGSDGKPTVFLFPETQIVKESFLEDINSILNSGEVPNLFDAPALEEISGVMRPICAAQGLPQTKAAMYAFFLSRVQENLHCVICMSPGTDTFRSRLRMYPSLLNCCSIDWFSEWPAEALTNVARSQLASIQFESEQQRASVFDVCRGIHESVARFSVRYFNEMGRFNAVTPTSYLELLAAYKKIMEEKKEEVGTNKNRFVVGLDKLAEATVQVQTLQQEIIELQPVLVKTSEEVDAMMITITADREEADKTKIIVEAQENEANAKAAKAKEIADDAQKDLDEALPALDAATASLKSLNKNDIVEVKAMKNPPAGVKLTMEAVCILMKVKPVRKDDPNQLGKKINDYWEPASKLLNDPPGFLNSLFTFDKDAMEESVITQVTPYVNGEHGEFTPASIEKASKACKSICMWVLAMHKYYHVAKMVEPKKELLASAQAELREVMAQLEEAKAKLKAVNEKLQRLQDELNAAVAKKEELGRKSEECNVKLGRAEKLIGGLGGEKLRWVATVEQLSKDFACIVGDVLVGAGTVAYLGAFTGDYRGSMVQEWNELLIQNSIQHTENCTIHTSLSDPVSIRAWQIAGLPSDPLSTENALIMQKARRWPLMIDPETQANSWVKNMEKVNNVEVVKLTSSNYLRSLENGIRFGRPVMIENILEELDPALEPLLLRITFKQNNQEMIQLGDSTVPWHPDFRFYMTTKLRNPIYKPETAVKVTLLNFAITSDGLQQQLLGLVVAEERPDLAEAKNNLVVQNAAMKKQMKEIEDTILRMLSEASGDILDDEGLINTLAASKKTSTEINEKLAQAEITEKEIDTTRVEYVPVAFRSSLLYFCVSDLSIIDPMYQYSLGWFMNLFRMGIQNSEMSPDDLERRLRSIIDYFTHSVYVNICRSLFEKHKLMFSFLLCIRIMQTEGKIDNDEFKFLLSGPTSNATDGDNPAPDWLTNSSWIELCGMSLHLPAFHGLSDIFREHISSFKDMFDSSSPESFALPADLPSRLSTFQRILILRGLRSDKVTNAVQGLVSSELGPAFIEPPPFDLLRCYQESTVKTPLIFVFSPGSDPAADLYKFADSMNMTRKLDSISLGQGQGPIAENLIKTGQDSGGWVFLQNCHLAVSWMPRLEKIVETTDEELVHRDYRLWLTSGPSKAFPVSVLQDGVKMTIEPPKGLKANLNRSFLQFDDEYLEDCSKSKEFRQLLYCLCFYHAIVQDRRKFGPLGWNISYDFAQSDLSICTLQLKLFLNDYEVIPFKVLQYLFSEINYGGRITDAQDRRANNVILEDYICKDALVNKYKLSPSGAYIVPTAKTQQDFLDYLKTLPVNPNPEVFGLHENADITSAQNETSELFANLLAMQPRSSGGGGASREDVIREKADDLIDRIPPHISLDNVNKKYPTMYEESMNTVLTQEVIRYNKLTSTINRTLKELLKALKGLVVMSEVLDGIGTALFNNTIPSAWADVAYPSLMPLASWATDLEMRLSFLNNWIDLGHPSVYWISGFFFPQAFLTAILQNFARKQQIGIDTISLDFVNQTVEHTSIQEKPADGAIVWGLFLEGCRWDISQNSLVESRPKELFTSYVPILLQPVQHRPKPDPATTLMCPCYKILTRKGVLSTTGHSTNFVTTIEVPTSTAPEHWVKRGVALFLALAY